MSEQAVQRIDEPSEELIGRFVTSCLELDRRGMQRFQVGDNQTAEIFVENIAIGYEVATPVADPNGDEHLLWTCIAHFDDGSLVKMSDSETVGEWLAGEAVLPLHRKGATAEILHRAIAVLGQDAAGQCLQAASEAREAEVALGLTAVSAVELQAAVDTMEAALNHQPG